MGFLHDEREEKEFKNHCKKFFCIFEKNKREIKRLQRKYGYKFNYSLESKEFWETVICSASLSAELIIDLKDFFEFKFSHTYYNNNDFWDFLIMFQEIPIELLLLAPRNKFKKISQYQKLTEKEILVLDYLLDWGIISQFQNLSERFILKYIDKIDFIKIFIRRRFSLDFFKYNLNIFVGHGILYLDVQNSKLYSEKELRSIKQIYDQYSDLVF